MTNLKIRKFVGNYILSDERFEEYKDKLFPFYNDYHHMYIAKNKIITDYPQELNILELKEVTITEKEKREFINKLLLPKIRKCL